MVIAERMGERLRQTSRSVNIRERLDFSCALFDSGGALVANAPHIPVHLGSMGEAVVDLLNQVKAGALPALADGDVVISNDPFHGGTHLPDITAMTPVYTGVIAVMSGRCVPPWKGSLLITTSPSASAGRAPAFT